MVKVKSGRWKVEDKGGRKSVKLKRSLSSWRAAEYS
jgi:hypothetical protein